MIIEDKSNCLFLLGGHDLEMHTIRDILSDCRIPYADRQLRWDNAMLSQYVEEINEFRAAHPSGHIYGIELINDLKLPSSFYKSIDHHNEFDERPCSLEQVLQLLQLPVNRRYMLVAANDSHYIPGLQKAGATLDEIIAIRYEDRRAQGVSAEDERLAEQAIASNMRYRGRLKVVRAYNACFSPICDRLYPYTSLLVYTDDEWTYYGKGVDKVRRWFEGEYLQEKLYCGGGTFGYIGTKKGIYTTNQINQQIEQIQNLIMYSYHIFYFPFNWSLKGKNDLNFSKQVDLMDIPVNVGSQWKHVQLDKQSCPEPGTQMMNDAFTLFNERQYFFDFVHPVLYDMVGDLTPLLHHYERVEPQVEKLVEYSIKIAKKKGQPVKEYKLRVDALNLNLYSTGVGILTFYLANESEDQQDEATIREINQYGRRIMPSNTGEFVQRNQLASSISIHGLCGDDSRYQDNFDYKDVFEHDTNRNSNSDSRQLGLHSVWQPAHFIQNLIQDLSPELEIKPVIDDRMLVNCWYGNDELSHQVAKSAQTAGDSFVMGDFWYKYVFVDEGAFDSCQNIQMKKQLLEKATYFRWQSYGTLYGVSRYSFMALTDTKEFSKNMIAVHMRTIYSRLFELIIIQRASMLRFSGEVTKVSSLAGEKGKEKEMSDRVGSLYEEYIRFVNQIYFRSVTAQDQGIDLYEILIAQFDLNGQIKDLDGEISELYQYITLQVDQKRNENGENLNKLAAMLLPATIIAGLFGMNRQADLYFHLDFWLHVIVIVGISILFFVLIKRILKL